MLKYFQLDFIYLIQDDKYFPGSDLLLTYQDQILVNSFYGKKTQKWKKVFDSKKSGTSSASFHTICNNKPNILIVLKAANGELIIFFLFNFFLFNFFNFFNF